MVYQVDKTYSILSRLATRGWVPLAHMATLIGYSHVVTVYQRQGTKRAIPTIRIGGVNRVSEDVVIHTLNNISDKHQAKMIISLYKRIKGNA